MRDLARPETLPPQPHSPAAHLSLDGAAQDSTRPHSAATFPLRRILVRSGTAVRMKVEGVQGYLAHKKNSPTRTLQ